MNFSKINIVKNITKKSEVTSKEAADVLESFLLLIKSQSKLRSVKLNRFGSFSFKNTPKRMGRNPKTKQSFEIRASKRLKFTPSLQIKILLN
jgi:nucleoid DNA-binding protein